MTISCHGVGVTSARTIAVGVAHLLYDDLPDVIPHQIQPSEVPHEVQRFHHALETAKSELSSVRQQIPNDTPTDISEFIDTHLLMLEDTALSDVTRSLIENDLYGAEWALHTRRKDLLSVFNAIEDPYLRTRQDDLNHLVNLVLKILMGCGNNHNIHTQLNQRIVIAHDLSPADTLMLRKHNIAGLITEFGSPMSHTAILARSLNIPAIVGVHHATKVFRDSEIIVLDTQRGQVIAEAEAIMLAQFHQKQAVEEEQQQQLRNIYPQPTITTDNQKIELLANIELPEDTLLSNEYGCDGIGLYRTEFLYMNRKDIPTEEEHYRNYSTVIKLLNGKPATFRTLDLGADKTSSTAGQRAGNPALGLRAIRLCLKEPALFVPQISALLRASIHGPIKIMLPMLTTMSEIQQIKQLISQISDQLSEHNIPYDKNIPIGGMIETPAAALLADSFAQQLDFLSIGSNDLAQYTLAVDRTDEELTYLFNPINPAVLLLIKMTIDAGKKYNKPVSLCGEIASDPKYTQLLLGMGLKQFSMQPCALISVKQKLIAADSGILKKRIDKMFTTIADHQLFQKELSTLIY